MLRKTLFLILILCILIPQGVAAEEREDQIDLSLDSILLLDGTYKATCTVTIKNGWGVVIVKFTTTATAEWNGDLVKIISGSSTTTYTAPGIQTDKLWTYKTPGYLENASYQVAWEYGSSWYGWKGITITIGANGPGRYFYCHVSKH